MIIEIINGVARRRTHTAQWPWVPSIGQNVKLLTGNGETFLSETENANKNTKIINFKDIAILLTRVKFIAELL